MGNFTWLYALWVLPAFFVMWLLTKKLSDEAKITLTTFYVLWILGSVTWFYITEIA